VSAIEISAKIYSRVLNDFGESAKQRITALYAAAGLMFGTIEKISGIKFPEYSIELAEEVSRILKCKTWIEKNNFDGGEDAIILNKMPLNITEYNDLRWKALYSDKYADYSIFTNTGFFDESLAAKCGGLKNNHVFLTAIAALQLDPGNQYYLDVAFLEAILELNISPFPDWLQDTIKAIPIVSNHAKDNAKIFFKVFSALSRPRYKTDDKLMQELERDTENPIYVYCLAYLSAKSLQWAQAIRSYNKLLKLLPEYEYLINENLQMCYRGMGDTKAVVSIAEKYVEKIRLDSNAQIPAMVIYSAVDILLSQDKIKLAMKYIKALMENQPYQKGFILCNFAGMLGNRGYLTDAAKFYEEALKFDYPFIYGEFAMILVKMKKFKEAENLLQKALNKYPVEPVVLNDAGVVYHRMSNSTRAEILWSRLFNMQKKYPFTASKAALNLALIYYEKKDFIKVKEYLRACLHLEPKMTKACINMGYIYQLEGKLKKAEIFYKRALQNYGGSVSALNNLAALYFETKRVDEAIKLLQKAYALDNDCVETLINLAVYYFKCGQNLKAAGYLMRISLDKAEINEKIVAAAILLEKLGKKEQAEKIFRLSGKMREKLRVMPVKMMLLEPVFELSAAN